MRRAFDAFRDFPMRGLAAAAMMAGVGLTGSVAAQEDRRGNPPEATIYRDAGFRGPAVAVSAANPDMGLAWRVNSIRIRSGRWEFCEKTRYRGTCRTFDTDMTLLNALTRGHVVQSIRPVGGGGGGGGGGPLPGDGGPSLRGMAAQFYTQPAQYGQRVRACTTGGGAVANCAARTADQFCKTMGWNGSASETMETVNRVAYLADVLCTRTGY